jgi:hypothetical protein
MVGAGDMPEFLGVVDAAAWCGVSEDSIRRRLKDGRLPGSERAADGAWRIPVEALRAARFGSGPRPRDRVQPPGLPRPTGPVRVEAPSAQIVEAQARHIADLQAEILRLHDLLRAMVGQPSVTPRPG